MRPSSLALPAQTAPRAPSTALLSVFWAALAVLAAWGVHQAKKGHDLSPVLRVAPLPAGEVFEANKVCTNADGVRVQFGAAHPEDDGVIHRGAIKVGDRYLALP